jgi:uncharacterized protein
MAKNDIRILVMCGDTWHSGGIAKRGLAALGNCGFAFEFLEDSAAWSPARLADFPVVVLAKSNVISARDKRPWLNAGSQRAFQDYVRRGNGLLVIHSGAAGYAEVPAMRTLTGGVFLRHPPECTVTVEPKAGHALAGDLASFAIQDEHYFMELTDAQVDVFLHTRSEHGVQPAGWTRTEDGGRVCVLTPGHNLEVWLHPALQRLLSNALRWAAKLN